MQRNTTQHNRANNDMHSQFMASRCGADDADAYFDERYADLAMSLVKSHLLTLTFQHSESKHQDILDSLKNPQIRKLIECVAATETGCRIDYDEFCDLIHEQAAIARKDGLVMPDEIKRDSKMAKIARLTGDLFSPEDLKQEKSDGFQKFDNKLAIQSH